MILRALSLLAALAGLAGASERPNFVVVMVDDMGDAGVSCFGNPYFETPEIDRLAAEGMRLTDFHSSGTVCTPTRAGLLTGRYQQRAGLEAVIVAGADHPEHPQGPAGRRGHLRRSPPRRRLRDRPDRQVAPGLSRQVPRVPPAGPRLRRVHRLPQRQRRLRQPRRRPRPPRLVARPLRDARGGLHHPPHQPPRRRLHPPPRGRAVLPLRRPRGHPQSRPGPRRPRPPRRRRLAIAGNRPTRPNGSRSSRP